ncbi:MAG: pilus assembly protein PilP [Paraglaciecola chathamensis]|jgi:type IV pilus assembly protein PilP|uniref:Pilus assembly protein PilP n=1 Tax=Paraglaciecola chathamensis TaxID=368405 RepID=A0A8H9M2M7_9ALTE|nr:pilus assembly protein PilP [Paraglaciecola oceanifecundans]GGZ53599.1 pilus assembly protein PilP [Paraglaciecola oceanifecundans]
MVFPMLALLVACSEQKEDLTAYIDDVKSTTPMNIEPYPEFTTSPAFAYSANEMRSPFQRLKNAPQVETTPATPTCPQPNTAHVKQPLEHYGIDAMAFIGTINNSQKKWALIQTNEGRLYRATIGDYLGLFYGRITAIKDGEITYTEMLPDGTGCWQKKQATLSMQDNAGENNG